MSTMMNGGKAEEEQKADASASDDRALGAAENKSKSISECAYEGIPADILGVGLVLAVTSPVMPVVSIAYMGSTAWLCYEARQDQTKTPGALTKEDMNKALAASEAREKNERTAMEMRQEQKRKEATSDERAEERMVARLKAAGEAEAKLIEKAAAKAVKDLYEEIDVIRSGKFEIRTDADDQEKAVAVPRRLRLDD